MSASGGSWPARIGQPLAPAGEREVAALEQIKKWDARGGERLHGAVRCGGGAPRAEQEHQVRIGYGRLIRKSPASESSGCASLGAWSSDTCSR